MRLRQAWSVLAVLSLASVAWAQEAPAPEAASGRTDRAAVEAQRFMIVTANSSRHRGGRRCPARTAAVRSMRWWRRS